MTVKTIFLVIKTQMKKVLVEGLCLRPFATTKGTKAMIHDQIIMIFYRQMAVDGKLLMVDYSLNKGIP